VNLEKAAWLSAVAIAWAVAAILFVEAYQGYAWVSIAIGFAASINLFGSSGSD
jgi:hypothetical protein